MNVQADTRPATLQAIGDLAGHPDIKLDDRDALLLIADCVRDLSDDTLRRTIHYLLTRAAVPEERMEPR